MSISAENKRRIATLVIASLLLALLGLYESYSYPFFVRWLYWATLVGIGIWLNDALSRQLEPLLASMPWLIRWLVHATALTIPLFAFVTTLQGFSGDPVPSGYYWDVAVKVWLVTAVLTAFGMRETKTIDAPEESAAVAEQEQANEETTPQSPKLLHRVKPELKNGTLLALAAEDHYVRVITDVGEELILLRFSDAIAEIQPVRGQQVHRSWWVAEHAIEALEKNNNSPELRLTNGLRVPISRRRLSELKQQGVLASLGSG